MAIITPTELDAEMATRISLATLEEKVNTYLRENTDPTKKEFRINLGVILTPSVGDALCASCIASGWSQAQWDTPSVAQVSILILTR